MRISLLASVLVLAAAADISGAAAAAPDPVACARAMTAYNTAAWAHPLQRFDEDGQTPPGALSKAVGAVRRQGCLTSGDDLGDLAALAARLSPYAIDNSGAAIRPTTVQIGIVTGISDEARVTAFVRALGYRSRGVGAEGLGRRLFIGPFTTESAVAQAIATAREAGFIAPVVAAHTRF